MVSSNQAEAAMRGATMMGAMAVPAWTLPDDDPEDLLEEPENA
jgi:hypothetical protein